jgi:hypothetical protein
MQKSELIIRSGLISEATFWPKGSAAVAQSTSGFEVLSAGLPSFSFKASAQRKTKPEVKNTA